MMGISVFLLLMFTSRSFSYSNIQQLKYISNFNGFKSSKITLNLVDPSVASIPNAFDASILGLLKPATSNLLNYLTGLGAGTTNFDFIGLNSDYFKLGELTQSFVEYVTAVTPTELPGFLNILDISKFPYLSDTLPKEIIELPIALRVTLGILILEVIPLILDVLLIKFIWKSLLSKDLSQYDITDLPRTYDKDKIAAYFSKKIPLISSRITGIIVEGKELGLGLLMDRIKNEVGMNKKVRARQLRELLTKLGPAYIKVGQGLSIRPDLLSVEYLDELSKLQEQVPPFNSDVALNIIRKELKVEPATIFQSLKAFDEPIAAASLGQVYKAKLKNGEDVAVKVQRPNMLITVTLDLFVSRTLFELGTYIDSVAETCKSLVTLTDSLAGRFVDELDYVKEAENSERFRLQMEDKETTLGDAIIVPKVYREVSSGMVLVSEWIEGTKLSGIDTKSETGKETVRKLTRVLLNSYLVQVSAISTCNFK